MTLNQELKEKFDVISLVSKAKQTLQKIKNYRIDYPQSYA